jgi:hypothetical protein
LLETTALDYFAGGTKVKNDFYDIETQTPSQRWFIEMQVSSKQRNCSGQQLNGKTKLK